MLEEAKLNKHNTNKLFFNLLFAVLLKLQAVQLYVVFIDKIHLHACVAITNYSSIDRWFCNIAICKDFYLLFLSTGQQ